MEYTKNLLLLYLDKIFGAFEKLDCREGQGGFFTRTWYNERTEQKFKVHLFDVLNVLIQNEYIHTDNNTSGLPFLKLTRKGYEFMQGSEFSLDQFSLFELMAENTSPKEVFDRLWDFIGLKNEAPFYLAGPDFFNTISSYIGLSSYNYSIFINERRKNGDSTSRIVWYRELFAKLQQNDIEPFLNELSDKIKNIYEPLFKESEEDDEFVPFDMPIKETPSIEPIEETETKVKKVIFISYTWETKITPGHKEWVKNLADNLIKADFDVLFDQYQPLGKNMNQFMVESVTKADRIILICTPTFKDCSDSMINASGYEASLISNELIKDITSTRFLPIVRIGEPRDSMPAYLGNRNALIWTKECSDDEKFQLLVDDLKNFS